MLVTGGYGFIGAHIVERFSKEGHDVCIVDDLSTGKKANVECRHKFYSLNIEDGRCEDVFQTGRFDLAVHCASPAAPGADPSGEQPGDLPGLINVLSLCKKHGVRHLIYLSSTEVYGPGPADGIGEDRPAKPVSWQGLNKLTAEQYCAAWSGYHGLSTLCLRLSHVYGPMMPSPFAPRQPRGRAAPREPGAYDFVYVEDVADAVYRAAMCTLAGVYNLSSNVCSDGAPLEALLQRYSPPGEDGTTAPAGDAGRRYDSRRIQAELDWTPHYSLEDGLRKTADWYESREKARYRYGLRRARRERTRRAGWKRLLPYAENALLFLAILALCVFLPTMFDSNRAVFLLAYISLMGIAYGSKQSIPAVALSLALFFYSALSSGESLLTLLYDPMDLFSIAALIFLGVFTGFSVDRRELRVLQNEERLVLLNEKYSFLQQINRENVAIKTALQNQIANSQESFGKVFHILQQIDSLEPERILRSAVRAAETVMKSDRVAVYALAGGRATTLRLVAASSAADNLCPHLVALAEGSPYERAARAGELFVNTRMERDLPFMIAPIRGGNDVLALLLLYQPAFEQTTLHYRNLFLVLAGLLSMAMTRAVEYRRLAAEKAAPGGPALLDMAVAEASGLGGAARRPALRGTDPAAEKGACHE